MDLHIGGAAAGLDLSRDGAFATHTSVRVTSVCRRGQLVVYTTVFAVPPNVMRFQCAGRLGALRAQHVSGPRSRYRAFNNVAGTSRYWRGSIATCWCSASRKRLLERVVMLAAAAGRVSCKAVGWQLRLVRSAQRSVSSFSSTAYAVDARVCAHTGEHRGMICPLR